jgi:hypothetical protein
MLELIIVKIKLQDPKSLHSNLACTRVLLTWYLAFSFRNNVILDGRTNSSVGFVGRTVLTESFYNEFWIRNPFLKV